jgi:hypothetical protein
MNSITLVKHKKCKAKEKWKQNTKAAQNKASHHVTLD